MVACVLATPLKGETAHNSCLAAAGRGSLDLQDLQGQKQKHPQQMVQEYWGRADATSSGTADPVRPKSWPESRGLPDQPASKLKCQYYPQTRAVSHCQLLEGKAVAHLVCLILPFQY